MNRRATHADNSAEMLELIAKVTAGISNRMDRQDEAIEEIRPLGRETKAQIIDRMPRPIETMQTEEREQVKPSIIVTGASGEHGDGVLTSGSIIVLLLTLILPTLLARHLLTCETIAGTWRVEDGQAYCFFRKLAS